MHEYSRKLELQTLAPLSSSGEELIKYACLHTPCFGNRVEIAARDIDKHAEFHGSNGISVMTSAIAREKVWGTP